MTEERNIVEAMSQVSPARTDTSVFTPGSVDIQSPRMTSPTSTEEPRDVSKIADARCVVCVRLCVCAFVCVCVYAGLCAGRASQVQVRLLWFLL